MSPASSAACSLRNIRPLPVRLAPAHVLILRFIYTDKQLLLLEVLHNLHYFLFNTLLSTLYDYLRILRLLIRSTNACEFLDLAFPRLRIQPFRVSRLRHRERNMHVYFYKRYGSRFVEFTGCSTIGAVGRDEGCKGNCAGIREEERNLQNTSLPVYHESVSL